MIKNSDLLLTAIKTATTKKAMDWLLTVCDEFEKSTDIENDLCNYSAMARRSLGTKLIGNNKYELISPHGNLNIATWEAGNAGRIFLLLKAIEHHPSNTIDLVRAVFRYGDEIERATIIRALIIFPEAEMLKFIALEAGRINSLMLYEALANHNPYPCTYYTQQEFNQYVMKTLFLGINIESIFGLQKRVNPELSRMCEDYIQERTDAQRAVPPDIWLAAVPHLSQQGKAVMDLFQIKDQQHRHYISLAKISL